MKKILSVLVFIFPSYVFAQDAKFKRFEFEIGGGYTFAITKSFPIIQGGPMINANGVSGRGIFYFEGRWHLKQLPLNIGMHIDVSAFYRKGIPATLFDIPVLVDYDFRSAVAIPFADYSFRRGKKVNPFVGLGLGVTFSNTGTGVFNDGFETNFCMMPRAGVRFFRHITVMMDYELSKRQYSHAGLKIGFSF